ARHTRTARKINVKPERKRCVRSGTKLHCPAVENDDCSRRSQVESKGERSRSGDNVAKLPGSQHFQLLSDVRKEASGQRNLGLWIEERRCGVRGCKRRSRRLHRHERVVVSNSHGLISYEVAPVTVKIPEALSWIVNVFPDVTVMSAESRIQ